MLIKTSSFLTMFNLFLFFLQLPLFARCRLLMLGMIRDTDKDFFFSYDVYSFPVLSSAISLCQVSFAYAGDDKRC